MDISGIPDSDVLSAPTRARLFEALAGLRRPASTAELAALVGRHPNTARVQLQRLEDAGLIECRRVTQRRGRPRHVWAIVPYARPGGAAPDAHANLSRWLARAMRQGHTQADLETGGREIGRELAPASTPIRESGQAMQDALTALGFAPHVEREAAGALRYVLGNCPYREAAAENPAVVCSLHRGITLGLLDRLAPSRQLTGFVAKDPFQAGCLVDITAA